MSCVTQTSLSDDAIDDIVHNSLREYIADPTATNAEKLVTLNTKLLHLAMEVTKHLSTQYVTASIHNVRGYYWCDDDYELLLPHGTDFYATRNQRRYHGFVSDGNLIYQGAAHTPASFCRAITGKLPSPWSMLFVRPPGTKLHVRAMSIATSRNNHSTVVLLSPDITIESLRASLSMRCYNALNNEGILTVAMVREHSISELLRIPNLGRRSLNELIHLGVIPPCRL